MKKQIKTKKLSLQKETLSNLQCVTGGTVYYPKESEQCSRGCPIKV